MLASPPMLASPDGRIQLAAAPQRTATLALEAVMIGLAPLACDPAQADDALAAAAMLGFTADARLCGAPLSFTAAAGFDAAFPDDASWLARAVHDFFAAGGLRVWVVRVEPGDDPLDRMVGIGAGGLVDPTSGIGVAMQVPDAGLLLLPDLEQACLAQVTPPPPPTPTPPATAPQFQPLADRLPPGPAPMVPPSVPLPIPPAEILGRVSAALAAQRPDMLCLFTLPVGADGERSLPALIARARAYVFGDRDDGPDLPRMQVFAPLLRDPDGTPVSPSGLLAGALAANAQTQGVWRALTGRTLPSAAMPLRRIESNALQALRAAGIVALRGGPGGIIPDGDILACRDRPASARLRAAPTRRLIGFLLRRLRSLGEQLVFENILDDGRVELVLHDCFATLLAQGALSGRSLDEAVRIASFTDGDGAIVFSIAIDAAVPVETIRLRFIDGTVATALEMAA